MAGSLRPYWTQRDSAGLCSVFLSRAEHSLPFYWFALLSDKESDKDRERVNASCWLLVACASVGCFLQAKPRRAPSGLSQVLSSAATTAAHDGQQRQTVGLHYRPRRGLSERGKKHCCCTDARIEAVTISKSVPFPSAAVAANGR